MPSTIEQVMTRHPVCVDPSATIEDAAREMNEHAIGAVLVAEGTEISGILTDRDIVVRGIAMGRDPAETRVSEVATASPATLKPDDSIERAVELLEGEAVRRLPVVEDGHPVGIVSIGDLAVERDPKSALGQISATASNN